MTDSYQSQPLLLSTELSLSSPPLSGPAYTSSQPHSALALPRGNEGEGEDVRDETMGLSNSSSTSSETIISDRTWKSGEIGNMEI